ncbi:putative pentatricopeptide repeat-containing protein [Acorus calamus]|uniref:Pentatricopeptide repeat-containing protein n=1 Tax=Acorus calamus TaxID=4465 RepID=A0AAV9DM38_ACOCL|nr:putative pentatricopeptide repeat-containing protein [Acorus calamus]
MTTVSITSHNTRWIGFPLKAFEDPRIGSAVHARLVKSRPDWRDHSPWNKLLQLYCRCESIQVSRKLFDAMPVRDSASFNTLISAYTRGGHRRVEEAFKLYSLMREDDVRPDKITFSLLLGACARRSDLRLSKQLHCQAVKSGLASEKFVGSSLSDTYSKCLILEDSIRAFDEIDGADLVSWNVVIDGCARHGSKEHAVRLFTQMRRHCQCPGFGFDAFTLTSVVKTCYNPCELVLGMSLHGCAIKAGLTAETPVANSLVTMYSKCEKGMESAKRVFETISTPDIISWTAMISGFAKNGLGEEAVGVYQEMLGTGARENDFCFAGVLPAIAGMASLEGGRQVHARICKSKFGLDMSVNNALIDMYFKCGNIGDARSAFGTLKFRDFVTYTVMIMGLGQHGLGKDALEMLKEMEDHDGLEPDGVTLLAALSTCSHNGLVEDGLCIFNSMVDGRRKVKPKREHYACVVDMLGRAGKLSEAENFIKESGIESEAFAWGTLLSACMIHGDSEVGERAAERLKELQPKRDGAYVQLSNIYAEKEMWAEKGDVRQGLDVSGLHKETGRSWVSQSPIIST